MRPSGGFTLVELIVVLSIITIITTMATLNWNQMVTKNAVEGQIKTVHADMMGVRLDSFYNKKSRSITVNGNVFNIYSSTNTAASVAPVSSRTFKYKFISTSANTTANDTVTFDTSGMMNGTQITLCIDAYNDSLKTSDAFVDSIVVSQGRINLAKRPEGGKCDTSASGVTQK